MSVAGIDLAWGERARTGVAVCDNAGRLVASGSARSDDDIADVLHGHRSAVIGIDAPIVVVNDSGMRPCERDLSRDFRAFHAGTHPSHRGRPGMSPMPRAMRLVQRFGWGIDPSTAPSPDAPVAIEVYPHSAMVSRFALERILAYKAKSGRAFAERHGQFASLLDLMERHCDEPLRLSESARWAHLRLAHATATRPFQLHLLEDEVDAIMCAFVAWTHATRPEALRHYGHVDTGVIVTFPPPIVATSA